MARKIKWTKEACLQAAKNYRNRKEFHGYCGGAYNACIKNGWLDEVMPLAARNSENDAFCIYLIFNNRKNMAYVGLTKQRFNTRMAAHKSDKNETRSREITKHEDTMYKQLTDYSLSKEEAEIRESELYVEYRNRGYTMLNSISMLGKGTSIKLGSKKPLPKKHYQSMASVFKTRAEFKENYPEQYNACSVCGWLDEFYPDEKRQRWTFELCAEIAMKHDTIKEFKKASRGAYEHAYNFGFLNKICAHMDPGPRGKYSSKWSEDAIKIDVVKFSSYTEFRRKSPGAYDAALRLGLADEIKNFFLMNELGYDGVKS